MVPYVNAHLKNTLIFSVDTTARPMCMSLESMSILMRGNMGAWPTGLKQAFQFSNAFFFLVIKVVYTF